MRKHGSAFSLMAPLLGALLSACSVFSPGAETGTAPAPSYAAGRTESAPTYAALPEDSVQVHDVSEPVPDSAVTVAEYMVPESMFSHTDAQVIASYRPQAARRGATWITVDPRGGQRRVVAYHVPLSVRIRHAARGTRPRPAATSTPSSGGSGSVHVGGYRRRDGMYVRPHTRSRPGSGSRPSTRPRGGSGSRRRG